MYVRTPDHKKKLSLIKIGKRRPDITGDKNGRWRGGISTENEKIRHSLESKLWQKGVKNKDHNRCQKCEENRLSVLTAHHIFNFSKYPELRFVIDNGITFCRPCHKEFHRIYTVKDNTPEQVKSFISK